MRRKFANKLAMVDKERYRRKTGQTQGERSMKNQKARESKEKHEK